MRTISDGIKRSYAVLTIDDIPSNNTIAFVDYLNEKGIPTVMFAWGEHIMEKSDQVILKRSEKYLSRLSADY